MRGATEVVDIDTTVEKITHLVEEGTHDDTARHRLAALWTLLDAHMSNGGALPTRWRTKNPCHI
jgi:hypothetical protein